MGQPIAPPEAGLGDVCAAPPYMVFHSSAVHVAVTSFIPVPFLVGGVRKGRRGRKGPDPS